VVIKVLFLDTQNGQEKHLVRTQEANMRNQDLVETLKQIAFEKNTEAKEEVPDNKETKATKKNKKTPDEVVINPVINSISNAR
jgi:hypothetical protein